MDYQLMILSGSILASQLSWQPGVPTQLLANWHRYM